MATSDLASHQRARSTGQGINSKMAPLRRRRQRAKAGKTGETYATGERFSDPGANGSSSSGVKVRAAAVAAGSFFLAGLLGAAGGAFSQRSGFIADSASAIWGSAQEAPSSALTQLGRSRDRARTIDIERGDGHCPSSRRS